ncbi:MAG: hypothetical protein BWY67_00403 [Bacteroidetes bacterium ADurb.Bin397]|nr:MAG: hypothetical protein BWY67_00403 [Bacteroidetes bacterium ADurb.Bin397]
MEWLSANSQPVKILILPIHLLISIEKRGGIRSSHYLKKNISGMQTKVSTSRNFGINTF